MRVQLLHREKRFQRKYISMQKSSSVWRCFESSRNTRASIIRWFKNDLWQQRLYDHVDLSWWLWNSHCVYNSSHFVQRHQTTYRVLHDSTQFICHNRQLRNLSTRNYSFKKCQRIDERETKKAHNCDERQDTRCETFRFDVIHTKLCVIVIEWIC